MPILQSNLGAQYSYVINGTESTAIALLLLLFIVVTTKLVFARVGVRVIQTGKISRASPKRPLPALFLCRLISGVLCLKNTI